MSQAHPTIEAGTGSADYSAAYFHGYSGPPYTYDEPHWKIFFGRIADSLVALFDPAKRSVDFRDEFALAIARAQFDRPVGLARRAIGQIGLAQRIDLQL